MLKLLKHIADRFLLKRLSPEFKVFIALDDKNREAKNPLERIESGKVALQMIDDIIPWPVGTLLQRQTKGLIYARIGHAYAELRAQSPNQYSANEIEALIQATKLLRRTDGDLWYQTIILKAQALENEDHNNLRASNKNAIALLETETERYKPKKYDPIYTDLLLTLAELYRSGITTETDRFLKAKTCVQTAYNHIDVRRNPQSLARAVVVESDIILDTSHQLSIVEHRTIIARIEETSSYFPEKNNPYEWGVLHATLGQVFAHGKSSWKRLELNFEYAIDATNIALKTFENIGDSAFPEQARCHSLRAAIYAKRIKGDWKTNLQEARRSALVALSFYTEKTHPLEHARTVNILAKLAKKEPDFKHTSDLIEQMEQALSNANIHSNQLLWSEIRYNLATAYLNQPPNTAQTKNIETAIELLNGLDGPRNIKPIETKHALAHAYVIRYYGEHWENLEKSVDLLEGCLTELSIAENPILYADLCGNLSRTYLDRQKGHHADNVEKSIVVAENALVVLHEIEFPTEHADLLAVLATAFNQRPRGSRKDNAREALSAFQKSRQIHETILGSTIPTSVEENILSNELHPLEFDPSVQPPKLTANSEKRNMKLLRYRLKSMDPEKDPLQAIQAHIDIAERLIYFNPAGKIDFTEEHCSRILAQFQLAIQELDTADKLASRYSLRAAELKILSTRAKAMEWIYVISEIQESQASKLKKISTYQKKQYSAHTCDLLNQNIEIRTKLFEQTSITINPRQHLKDAVILAKLHVNKRSWTKAAAVLSSANNAATSLIGSPEISQAETFDIIQDLDDFANVLPIAWIHAGDQKQAIIEADATRALIMAKTLSIRSADIDSTSQQRLSHLSEEIAFREQELSSAMLIDRQTPLQQIIELKEELKTLCTTSCPRFKATWTELEQKLASLLADDTCILLLSYSSFGGTAVAILKDDSTLKIETFELGNLRSLKVTIQNAADWRQALERAGNSSAGSSHRTKEIGTSLGEHFYVPFCNWISGLGMPAPRHISIISSSGLSSTPLYLSQNQNRILADDYSISFCTNIRSSRQFSLHGIDSTDRMGLGLISNPERQDSEPLIFATVEGEIVKSFVERKTTVERAEANLAGAIATMKNSQIWHFSCHAEFDSLHPLKSQILLSGQDYISTESLLRHYDIPSPELVVLSACQTGLCDSKLTEEYTGLTGAFLQLGAKGVVASLWSVSDLASCLIISLFYKNLFVERIPAPRALYEAQIWIRHATKSDILNLVQTWKSEERINETNARNLYDAIAACQGQYPFSDPFYWSSFVYYGF